VSIMMLTLFAVIHAGLKQIYDQVNQARSVRLTDPLHRLASG
jgi:hypothetical protein